MAAVAVCWLMVALLATTGVAQPFVPSTQLARDHPVTSLTPVDINNDGLLDLLVTSNPSFPQSGLGWLQNTASGFGGAVQPIACNTPYPKAATAAFLDSDDNIDVVWCGEGLIGWTAAGPAANYTYAHTLMVANCSDVWVDNIAGNGYIDVVAATKYGVFWWANDGHGNFQKHSLTTESATKVRGGDVNGDGRRDLVVSQTSGLVWFAGMQGGGLQPMPLLTLQSGSTQQGLVVADVTGDGVDDIVAGGPGVEILLLSRTADNHTWTISELPRKGSLVLFLNGIYVSDVDGDGRLDILSIWVSSLFLVRNFGHGNFQSELLSESFTGSFTAVTACDARGAGVMDVFIGLGFSEQSIAVMRNTASRPLLDSAALLRPSADVDIGATSAVPPIVADFGQGYPQFLIREKNLTLQHFNTTTGTMHARSLGLGARAFAACQLTDSGRTDIVYGQDDTHEVSWLRNTGVQHGHAQFTRMPTTTVPSSLFQLTCGDVYGRGRMDVVVASESRLAIYVLSPLTNGSFAVNPITLHGDGDSLAWLELADFNNDGALDMVYATSGVGLGVSDIYVLMNNGINAGFTQSLLFARSVFLQQVTVADINQDGYLDIITVVPAANQFVYALNLGTAAHSTTSIFANISELNTVVQNPQFVAVGDIVGSGWLSVCTAGVKALECLTNLDGNSWGSATVAMKNANSHPITMADLDGDGQLDLLLQTFSGALYWLRNLRRAIRVRAVDWVDSSTQPTTHSSPSFPLPIKTCRALIPGVNPHTRFPAPAIVHVLANASSTFNLTAPLTLTPVPFSPSSEVVVVLPPVRITVHCCGQGTNSLCVHIPSSGVLRWAGGTFHILGCHRPQNNGAHMVHVTGKNMQFHFAPMCTTLWGTLENCRALSPDFILNKTVPWPSPMLELGGLSHGGLRIAFSRFAAYGWPGQTVGLVRYCLGGSGAGLYADVATVALRYWRFVENTAQIEGGAIMCNSCTLNLTYVAFLGNFAATGGALGTSPRCVVTMRHVQFSYNAALTGGAMELGSATPQHNHLLHSVYASENKALAQGGGVLEATTSTVILRNCTFVHNTAVHGHGGVARITHQSSAVFTDVVMDRNIAQEGGAVSLLQSSAGFTGGSMTRNTAIASGGAMSLLFADVSMKSLTFAHNAATFMGGAISCEGTGDVFSTLGDTGSTFLDNTAGQGGGVAATSCSPFLVNTRFERNHAITTQDSSSTNVQGGCVMINNGPTGSIAWRNVSLTGCTSYGPGGGLWVSMASASLQLMDNCTIEHNAAQTGGGGGVYAQQLLPSMSSTVVRANTAVYSPNTGTNTRSLVLRVDTVSSTEQQSGVQFIGELVLELQDHFSEVVLAESKTTLTLHSPSSDLLVLQSGAVVADKGVFNVTGVFALLAPRFNTTYSLSWQLGASSALTDTSAGNLQYPGPLQVRIGPCGRGTFGDTTSHRCVPCSAGTFSASAGASACSSCPPGRFSSSQGTSACDDCLEPLYSEHHRATVCSRCQPGTLWLNNTQPCGLCPSGQVAQDGVCVCPLLTIRRDDGVNVQCEPCSDIQGALCPSNITNLSPAQVQALPGFWRDPQQSLNFIECPFETSCTPTGCSAHAHGPCCMQCKEGTYRDINGQCSACASGSVSALAALLSVLCLVVVGCLVLYMHNVNIEWVERKVSMDSELDMLPAAYVPPGSGNNAPVVEPTPVKVCSRLHRASVYSHRGTSTCQVTALFKIVVGHIQILVLVAASGAFSANSSSQGGFPRDLRRFAAYLGAGVLRVFRVVPLACASSSPYQLNIVLTLVLPIVLVALVCVAAVLLRLVRRCVGRRPLSWLDVYRRAVKAACVLMVLIYPLTTAELLETFYHRTCGSYLDSVGIDAGLSTSSHAYPSTLALSIVGLVVLSVGLPFGFALLLFLNKHSLSDTGSEVSLKFSVLYQDLKPSRWWFFPVSMLEKALYALLAVLLAGRPTQQYTLEVLLTVFIVVFLAIVRPYADWLLCLLVWSRLAIFLTVFGAAVLQMQSLRHDNGSLQGRGDHVVSPSTLGAVLIVVNLSALLLPCACFAWMVYGQCRQLQRNKALSRKSLLRNAQL